MTTTHEEIIDYLLTKNNWEKNVYLISGEYQKSGFHACNCNGNNIIKTP